MSNTFYGDNNIQVRKQQLNARFEAIKAEAAERDKLDVDQRRYEAFREKVKSTITKLVDTKEAPWLKSHNGDTRLSYFPETNYEPQGFTAVWLKIREQELGSSDPRWFSRKDIFANGYHIGHNEKATIMGFRGSDDSIKYNYYWNASQLSKIPPYEKAYTVSQEQSPIYRPQTTGQGKDKTYHPQETLRADITNWFTSIATHTPYEPKGLNRTEQVKEYIEKSNPGMFFYVAKDASDTSKKMIEKTQDSFRQKEQKNEKNIGLEL